MLAQLSFPCLPYAPGQYWPVLRIRYHLDGPGDPVILQDIPVSGPDQILSARLDRCAWCQRWFIASQPGQLYCRKACRHRQNNDKRKHLPIVTEDPRPTTPAAISDRDLQKSVRQ